MLTHTHFRRTLRGALRGLGWMLASALALLLIVCLLVLLQARRDETRSATAAVVLGAAQWNGDPSPVLQARLDHARDLYRRGIVPRLILTGGVGQGDTSSEAAVGRDYLLGQGVAPEAILLEEQGTTTLESLSGAAAIARANGIGPMLVVSDSYHMLRALKMARDLGLDATPAPVHTAEPSSPVDIAVYVVREATAYLVYVFARQ